LVEEESIHNKFAYCVMCLLHSRPAISIFEPVYRPSNQIEFDHELSARLSPLPRHHNRRFQFWKNPNFK